ncbi:MAG: hypothetical protein K6E86_10295 [Bacteroidales bacterium]|nr:hypothetical protein [Bacteroidales bacterium]
MKKNLLLRSVSLCFSVLTFALLLSACGSKGSESPSASQSDAVSSLPDHEICIEDLQFIDRNDTLYVYTGDEVVDGTVWSADHCVQMEVVEGVCRQFFFFDENQYLSCRFSNQHKVFYDKHGDEITEQQYMQQYPAEANALQRRHAAIIETIISKQKK